MFWAFMGFWYEDFVRVYPRIGKVVRSEDRVVHVGKEDEGYLTFFRIEDVIRS